MDSGEVVSPPSKAGRLTPRYSLIPGTRRSTFNDSGIRAVIRRRCPPIARLMRAKTILPEQSRAGALRTECRLPAEAARIAFPVHVWAREVGVGVALPPAGRFPGPTGTRGRRA